MPLVSVIVPNYNHAKFLPARLESIFSQTYQNFEVIILDDRSTDDSAQIIHQYTNHPKVSRVMFNEENSGSTFKQWLKGIEAAAGEYIWIAESDDWCEPTFLSAMVNGLTAKASCVVAYCQSYCILNENIIQWQSEYPLLQDYQEGKSFIQQYMAQRNVIFNASMGVWKKDIFENISKEFINYKFCGDWLFWIELCTFGDVFISGKLLNYFRKHDKDVSGKAYETGLNFIEEIRIINYIYSKNILDHTTYLTLLKAQYLGYKLNEHALHTDDRAVIKSAFFFTPRIKNVLRAHYTTFKVKHTVKTWMMGAFTKPAR